MKQLFTVYDSKADTYLNPFVVNSKGEAIRSFSDAVNDPQTQLNKHAEDFTLFHLAEWDDATGNLELNNTPIATIKAIEVKKITPLVETPVRAIK